MIRDIKDIIADMRDYVKPMIASALLEENFEGMGKTDKAEFETEFEMVLTLAEMAISQSSCEDAISRSRLKECFHRNVVNGEAFDDLIDAQPSVTPTREHRTCKDCKYCHENHYENEGESPYIKLECTATRNTRFYRIDENFYCADFCPKCEADKEGE